MKKKSLNNKQSQKGFTLVELSLAICFISILVIMIAYISSQIITIFQKGQSINAISTTGKELIADITRSISEAPREEFSTSAGDSSISEISGIYFQKRNGDSPIYGAFCTGKYSYIWKTGFAIREKNTYARVKYGDNGDGDFRLLRVSDINRKMCTEGKGGSFPKVDDNPTEMLTNNNPKLAIYSFTIFDPAVSDKNSSLSADINNYRMFYSGSFVLATELYEDASIMPTGCQASQDSLSSLSSRNAYCAINKFNFAARAMGE